MYSIIEVKIHRREVLTIFPGNIGLCEASQVRIKDHTKNLLFQHLVSLL